jgi:hypothetical protein
MAADLTSGDTPAAPDPVAAIAVPAEPVAAQTGPGRQHRVRFGIIYGALAAVLVTAIVALGVFATRSINPAPQWSAWKPTGGGQGAAHQIADHVAQRYRLPNGDQLVDIISKAPSITPTTSTLPIHYIAVRGTKGQQDQDYAVSSTNSVMYSLCGLGTGCQIATGKPSVERGRLVRREILELALYTFKYVGGIQNVIAFMPATAGKTAKYVVFLRPNDVTAQLKQPLATTLGKNVPLPKAIPAHEAHAIDTTTGPRLYSFSGVAQAPQGDLVFVLAPATA